MAEPIPTLQIRTFRTHKDGEQDDECQDSVYPDAGIDIAVEAGRTDVAARDEPISRWQVLAVADGTTQSFFSGLWAKALTSFFAKTSRKAFESREGGKWHEWLAEPRNRWREEVIDLVDHKLKGDLFARNNLEEQRPAAATFVGLEIGRPTADGVIPWRALVLGDSCLFHLLSDGRVDSYVKKKVEDFSFVTESAESYARIISHSEGASRDSRPQEDPYPPQVVRSASAAALELNQSPNPAAGDVFLPAPDARAGDVFLLATDALSKWMLAQQEADEPVWGTIMELRGAEFQKLVRDARGERARQLENDDVALAIARLGRPHPVFAGQKYQRMRVTGAADSEMPAPPQSPGTGSPVGDPIRGHKFPLVVKVILGMLALLGISLAINGVLITKLRRADEEKKRLEMQKYIYDRMVDIEPRLEKLANDAGQLASNLRELRKRVLGPVAAESGSGSPPEELTAKQTNGPPSQENERDITGQKNDNE